MSGTRRRLVWERELDDAMRWRDWQTCDQLLEEQPPETRLACLIRGLQGRGSFGSRRVLSGRKQP